MSSSGQPTQYSDTVLSEQALYVLGRVGWTPQRKLDITEQRKALLEAEFVLTPVIEDFIERFDQLYISVELPVQELARGMNKIIIHINVYDWLDNDFLEQRQAFEACIGDRVVPIGARSDYDMFLNITGRGAIYGDFYGIYYFYASSPIAFFNKASALDFHYEPVFQYDLSKWRLPL